MSIKRRQSLSPQNQSPTTNTTTQQTTENDIKKRVITCLNKLNDRDTLTLATNELDSIAKTLTPQTLPAFITCIQNTDLSCSKSPVKKQCVNLLATLSVLHGPSLSPHLPKVVAALLRFLRDHHRDSAVRSACVAAASAVSAHVSTTDVFGVLLRPMVDMVVVEQEVNVQAGAALCLAAAIEAMPAREEVEEELRRVVLPKMGKLVKGDGFKAKAAVLGVMGSVVGVGGASTRGVLEWVVKCFVKFLSCDDWVARKAAAEGLGKVAVKEKELAVEHKVSCLASLLNRRFDKVKVVRETMNRTLELWKEVPGLAEDVPVPSTSRSSSFDNRCSPSSTKSSHDLGFRTPEPKKRVPSNSSPPSDSSCVTTAKKQSPPKNDNYSKSSFSSRLDHKEPSKWEIETVALHDSLCGDDIKIYGSGVMEFQEDKKKVSGFLNDKLQKFSGFRSGSRVVPIIDDDYFQDKDVQVINPSEDLFENHRDIEDLSLIREHLLHIENQQSNLLNLLQRYIGSSQKGINSLETRVHGLEMALDEISYDLAVSSGRIPETAFRKNKCCKLPVAEFLSPKPWRRSEGRYSSPTFSSFLSGQSPSPFAVRNVPDKEPGMESYKPDSGRFQLQDLGGSKRIPSTDIHSTVTGTSGF